MAPKQQTTYEQARWEAMGSLNSIQAPVWQEYQTLRAAGAETPLSLRVRLVHCGIEASIFAPADASDLRCRPPK